jgi:5-methylcytosine-specific restriction endonuclease McrA
MITNEPVIEPTKHVQDFHKIIRNCSVENTYKMAWARAIIEIILEDGSGDEIYLEQIAKKVTKYYWNQTIFFDLNQGSNINKPPVIISLVKNSIEDYFKRKGANKPVRYERVESEVNIDIGAVIKILKKDVSWRFLKLNGLDIQLYSFSENSDGILLKDADALRQVGDFLTDSINYRWTQILEQFNTAPRIGKKVRLSDLGEVKRGNLAKFKDFITSENPKKTCFICGEPIPEQELSIDHVIPWSFLFSDDIWNLVYVHQSCNSRKSNSIPSEHEIKKLETRNKRLLASLNADAQLSKSKQAKELQMAIERDYVRKFWIGCRN